MLCLQRATLSESLAILIETNKQTVLVYTRENDSRDIVKMSWDFP